MEYLFIDSVNPDSAKQIGDLYKEVGWWNEAPEEPEVLRKIITGSHCFVTALSDGSVVGIGRAISDGVSDAYVQDIAVKKDCRGQGIANKIVTKIVERLKEDGIDWIGTVAERGTSKLYETLGFEPMPDSEALLFKG